MRIQIKMHTECEHDSCLSFEDGPNTLITHLEGLSSAHAGSNMKGSVVVVQLSHSTQLDAFFVIQKDLKKSRIKIQLHFT